MMIQTEEYIKHPVFSALDYYAKFYESLSWSVFSFCTTGTTAVYNIDSYVFSSVKGTLESILTILKDGRINDAYALLRKYYDSVIINTYSNLYLEDNVNIENFIVTKINNWIKGKDQLPEYRIMSSYIRNSEKVAEINDILYSTPRYKNIRERCNDHTHYNFFFNVILNDNEININDRIRVLDTLSADVKDVFILHLAYLFFLKGYYMTSSDYLDALECDIVPVEGSQYWVAPFIQEVFDNILSKQRPDIVNAIKKKTYMELA